MISIEPQGKVYLCRTELENDYKHQLTFANLQAQENYFNSVVAYHIGGDNYTYIKKDNVINVNENIEKIISCNYLFYRNDGFYDASGNIKTYYCFINNMEYVNENCTRIYFETDVIQTYQFDINYKASFVEREHTNDDTIGLNTYPENLETGPYKVYAHLSDSYNGELALVTLSTVGPSDLESYSMNIYNNILNSDHILNIYAYCNNLYRFLNRS